MILKNLFQFFLTINTFIQIKKCMTFLALPKVGEYQYMCDLLDPNLNVGEYLHLLS